MRLDLHLYVHEDPSTTGRLDRIEAMLQSLISQGTTLMTDLTQLKAAVDAEGTVVQGAVTLIEGLAAKIAALPPDQASIDALAAEVKGQSDALAAAVAANTPAAPAAPAA